MHEYQARLIRCVDGDTFDADVDLGFYCFVTLRFRVLDVDTPERGQPGFHESTEKLEQLLEECSINGKFVIRSHKTGKFGRWLASVMHPSMRMIGPMLTEWMNEQDWNNQATSGRP